MLVLVGETDQGAEDLGLVDRAAGAAAQGKGELVEGEGIVLVQEQRVLAGLGQGPVIRYDLSLLRQLTTRANIAP
ncbi:hypothetical protein [Streptomyces sp. enrichment culture]|uniref:hypothetical protein n=1 Tax=Streptomyces sp. enrichment culture TaxID=1795815 RepID=UPI003F551EE9